MHLIARKTGCTFGFHLRPVGSPSEHSPLERNKRGVILGMFHAFPSMSDYEPEALIEMADRHDDGAFATLLGKCSAFTYRDGLYEVLTGLPSPNANLLFGMHVPNVVNYVREVTARLKEIQAPAHWWVGPCTTPPELTELLVEAGWSEGEGCPAMVADLANLAVCPHPQGFELREVRRDEDLAEWRRILSLNSGFWEEVGELMSPWEEKSLTFYTAFLGLEAVGTTALYIQEGVPGIYCVTVLPQFRGQGIGSLLTALPLMKCREMGFRTATLQSSKQGYSVYRRLGFREVCRLRVFEFPSSSSPVTVH